MKSKRSKAWWQRRYDKMVAIARVHNPDFAFEMEVLGMQEISTRYTWAMVKFLSMGGNFL